MTEPLKALQAQFTNQDRSSCLNEEAVLSFAKDTKSLLLFDYLNPTYDEHEFLALGEQVAADFDALLCPLVTQDIPGKKARFFAALPEIRRSLNTSIDAIYEGDPAALSKQQVALEYPGFLAILYYRIAHEFYQMGLLLLARYLAERAHSKTGIDINPGATIGDYFFIDHGTGIVIGETCQIGNHVKLYQGVTLGALSLAEGRALHGAKRHPTVEDHVTIYSNAAIFGGDTVVGEGSTIGGDVYLTRSVPPHSVVLLGDSGVTIRHKQ